MKCKYSDSPCESCDECDLSDHLACECPGDYEHEVELARSIGWEKQKAEWLQKKTSNQKWVGIDFDHITETSDINGEPLTWVYICENCIERYEIDSRLISDDGSAAACGVSGCKNTSGYCVEIQSSKKGV